MSHDIPSAAAILGIGPRKLRNFLHEVGVTAPDGSLTTAHRGAGRFEVSTRAWWSYSLQKNVHYAVVVVTEAGIAWLANKLGIPVINHPPRINQNHAAPTDGPRR